MFSPVVIKLLLPLKDLPLTKDFLLITDEQWMPMHIMSYSKLTGNQKLKAQEAWATFSTSTLSTTVAGDTYRQSLVDTLNKLNEIVTAQQITNNTQPNNSEIQITSIEYIEDSQNNISIIQMTSNEIVIEQQT